MNNIVKEQSVENDIRTWEDLFYQETVFKDIEQHVRDAKTFVDRQFGGTPRDLHTNLIIINLRKAKLKIEELERIVARVGGVK